MSDSEDCAKVFYPGSKFQVTSLAVHALLGSSAEAKAAVALLSTLRGADSVALISGLIQKQPLHLLQSLPLPEQVWMDGFALELWVGYVGDCFICFLADRLIKDLGINW